MEEVITLPEMEKNKKIFFLLVYKEDHWKSKAPSHCIFCLDKGSNGNKSLPFWQVAIFFL